MRAQSRLLTLPPRRTAAADSPRAVAPSPARCPTTAANTITCCCSCCTPHPTARRCPAAAPPPLLLIHTYVLLSAPACHRLHGVFQEVWRAEGFRGFFPLRVIVTNSAEDIVKKGCFYIIYVLVKRAYESAFGSLSGRYAANLVVGYLTALLNSIPILPMETISTRVITNKMREGPLTLARRIWAERGLAGFYEGWEAYPFLSLKPAIQETVIDQSKILFLAWRGRAALRGAEGASCTWLVRDPCLSTALPLLLSPQQVSCWVDGGE